jgi:glycosyltransferase involved in cell wall biosynthesis
LHENSVDLKFGLRCKAKQVKRVLREYILISATGAAPKLLYVTNVDWYFLLHWMDRANAAQEAGYEVHLALCITSSENLGLLESKGYYVHEIPFERGRPRILTELSCFWRCYLLLIRSRPEVCHAITLKPVAYIGIIQRLRNKAAILSLPGLGMLSRATSLKGRLFWRILKRLLALALAGENKAMFETYADIKSLIGETSEAAHRAILVPGAGVDFEYFKVVPAPEKGPIRVLFAARLLKPKGLHYLVEAIRMLKAKNVAVELHVAGILDPSSMVSIPISEIEAWHKQSLIIWHGQVNDMAGLISDTHIVALPTSYGEGIPRILIEAAACGRPVIATYETGCQEFVKDQVDGYLVYPHDVLGLVESIEKLVCSPKIRENMGAAAREKVEKHYSNKCVIDITLACYDSLLEKHL